MIKIKITNIELESFYNDLCCEVLQLNKNDIIQKYEIDNEIYYLYCYQEGSTPSFKNCVLISDEDIDKEIDTFYKDYFYIRHEGQKFDNYEIRCVKKEAVLHVAKNLGKISIDSLAQKINHNIELKADIYDKKIELTF